MQEIEDPIDESIVAAIPQVGLQKRKAGNAVLVLDDQFAVEQRCLRGKRGYRLGNSAEPVRPIELFSCQQPHLAVIEPGLDAVAIEFDLVNPFRTVWWAAVQRRKARRHEVRKAVPLPGCAPRAAAASRLDRHGCLGRGHSFRAGLASASRLVSGPGFGTWFALG